MANKMLCLANVRLCSPNPWHRGTDVGVAVVPRVDGFEPVVHADRSNRVPLLRYKSEPWHLRKTCMRWWVQGRARALWQRHLLLNETSASNAAGGCSGRLFSTRDYNYPTKVRQRDVEKGAKNAAKNWQKPVTSSLLPRCDESVLTCLVENTRRLDGSSSKRDAEELHHPVDTWIVRRRKDRQL